LFQSWVIANYKLSKYLASNSNSYEPPVKNLLNPFRREKILYLKVLALFYVLNIILTLENKRHDILFIEKPQNLINDKISIFSLNKITYIILG
jgi:hypothetical protein